MIGAKYTAIDYHVHTKIITNWSLRFPMPTGFVTRTLPYPCERLFDIAADIEAYPAYLPGWVEARIIERSDTHLLVRQQLGLRLLRQSFSSRATLERPRRISVYAEDGPFRELTIEWRFEAAAASQCRVSLGFSFTLRSAYLAPMAELLFDQTSAQVIARFEQRARQLCAPV